MLVAIVKRKEGGEAVDFIPFRRMQITGEGGVRWTQG